MQFRKLHSYDEFEKISLGRYLMTEDYYTLLSEQIANSLTVVKEFRESIFNAADPLSQVYKLRRQKAKNTATPLNKTNTSRSSSHSPK